MSYILEALKKLEQKRQQEGTPNLLTLQECMSPAHKKRARWPYIVSGFIFICIAIMAVLLWVRPWEKASQLFLPKAKLASDVTLPAQPSAPQARMEEPTAVDVPQQEKRNPDQTAPSQPPTPSPTKITPEPVSPKTFPSQPTPASITPEEPTPKLTKQLQPNKKIVPIKELPAEIKSKLSELKMTVHSYNEQPQSRFAVINNNTVREGQSINSELKLEQITQSGVVLSFQGYRFSLGINENP